MRDERNHSLLSMVLFVTISVLIVAPLLVFGLNWYEASLRTFSPANIETISRQANERWQALEQTRMDVADLQTQVDSFQALYGSNTAQWPQGKASEYQQLLTQLANRKSAYRRDCASYKAMWEDEWQSIPAPDDLPTTCPNL